MRKTITSFGRDAFHAARINQRSCSTDQGAPPDPHEELARRRTSVGACSRNRARASGRMRASRQAPALARVAAGPRCSIFDECRTGTAVDVRPRRPSVVLLILPERAGFASVTTRHGG